MAKLLGGTTVAGDLSASGSVNVGGTAYIGSAAYIGSVGLKAALGGVVWTLTLPTYAGSTGYVLRTDGAGVTSWVANSGAGAQGPQGPTNMPINSYTTSASYTVASTDVGKVINWGTNYSGSVGIIINNGVFNPGDSFGVYFNPPSLGTTGYIVMGAPTSSLTKLWTAASTVGYTGSKQLSYHGMCTVWFLGSNEAVITGAGVSG